MRQAESALRFSFGRFNTDADIEAAAAQVREAVQRLRAVSPAAPAAPVHAGAAGGAGRDAQSHGAGAVFPPGAAPARWRTATGTVLRGEAGQESGEVWVRLHLRVRADTVIEARFQALGCPHTLATASWLVMQLAGRKRPERAARLTPGLGANAWGAGGKAGSTAADRGRLACCTCAMALNMALRWDTPWQSH